MLLAESTRLLSWIEILNNHLQTDMGPPSGSDFSKPKMNNRLKASIRWGRCLIVSPISAYTTTDFVNQASICTHWRRLGMFVLGLACLVLGSRPFTLVSAYPFPTAWCYSTKQYSSGVEPTRSHKPKSTQFLNSTLLTHDESRICKAGIPHYARCSVCVVCLAAADTTKYNLFHSGRQTELVSPERVRWLVVANSDDHSTRCYTNRFLDRIGCRSKAICRGEVPLHKYTLNNFSHVYETKLLVCHSNDTSIDKA